MRTPLLFALALVAVSSAATSGPCQWSTAEADLTTPPTGINYGGDGPSADEGISYVFQDICKSGPDCVGSFWIYQESNGIEGPQRGDEVEDNTCGGNIEPDTIIL